MPVNELTSSLSFFVHSLVLQEEFQEADETRVFQSDISSWFQLYAKPTRRHRAKQELEREAILSKAENSFGSVKKIKFDETE